MSERSTWTSVLVRAKDIKRWDVVLIGGLVFTRLTPDMPLSKAALRQKGRYVEVIGVHVNGGWIEFAFLGGDSPANERTMYALFRPYELVRVEVERA